MTFMKLKFILKSKIHVFQGEYINDVVPFFDVSLTFTTKEVVVYRFG